MSENDISYSYNHETKGFISETKLNFSLDSIDNKNFVIGMIEDLLK